MKRNVGGRILYVLLALVLLACIVPVSALLVFAESEAVTIYASNLNDDSQLSLSDDTVLVMDVDRQLSAIIGEDYDLTIEGSGKLTVNGSGNGIAVKSLHCTSDLFVQPGWHAIDVSETVYIDNAESFIVGGIYAAGKIDIRSNNATIAGNDYAISSTLGSITLSGATFDIGANGVAVFANVGDITMDGDFTVNSNDGRTIDAREGAVTINGSLKSTSGVQFDPEVSFANRDWFSIGAAGGFSFYGTTLEVTGLGGILAGANVNDSDIFITADSVSIIVERYRALYGKYIYVDSDELWLENEGSEENENVIYDFSTVYAEGDVTLSSESGGIVGEIALKVFGTLTLNGNFVVGGDSDHDTPLILADRMEATGTLVLRSSTGVAVDASDCFSFNGTTLDIEAYGGIDAEGGVNITADNVSVFTQKLSCIEGQTVYIDCGVLRLENEPDVNDPEVGQYGIACYESATVNCPDATIITCDHGVYGNGCDVTLNGNFTILGKGSFGKGIWASNLYLDGGQFTVSSNILQAIDAGRVEVKGNLSVSTKGEENCVAAQEFVFDGTTLTANGYSGIVAGNIDITADSAMIITSAYGVYSETGNITLNGNFTVSAQINAVRATNGTITMTGAVTAQNTNEYEYVIYAMGDISFTGTTLNVTGDYGISSAEGDISIVADSTTVITDVGAPIKTYVFTFGDYIGAEGGSVYIDSDYLYLHNKMEYEDHPLATWDGIMAGTNVTVYSQNATIVGKYGVSAIGDIKLYGNFDIAGGLESAVWSDEGDITLNGIITARAPYADGYAICAYEGSIILADGALDATTGGEYALYAENGIQMDPSLSMILPEAGRMEANTIVDANGDPADQVLIGKLISEISVNVNTPVAGKEPIRYSGQVYNMPLGSSVRAIRWYKNGEPWDVSSGNARFEAGNTYRLEISLVTHDGYYFADPLTSAAINYQTAAVSAPTGQPAYELVLSLDFGKCPAVISNVELTIDAPRENDFPDQSVTCGSSIYEQALVGDNMFDTPLQWQKSEDGITWTTMDLNETFAVGYYYRVFIDIMPANGYRFAIDPQIEPDVSAKVNGFRAEVSRYPEEDPEELISVCYNFGLLNHSIIQQIDIDGVTEPVVGEHPSYDCAISGTGYGINTAYSNGTYVINGICWYDVTYEMWMRPDDTFEIGHEYKVFIDVKTEDGYEFDTEQVGSSYRPVGWGYINDNYATLGIQSDGRYEQSLSWTFTCKPQTVKSVMVSGLDAPESGATPDFDAITDSEYYIVDSVTWFDYTTGLDLTASDTFVEGHEYWVLVTVIPSQIDGQKMCNFVADKTVATLNGIEVRKETNKHWQEVESSINFVRIYYTFICGEEDPIAIRVQPTSQTVEEGSQIQFSVIATGEGLTYQWQYRTSSTGSWKDTTLSGAKTNTLKVTASNVRNGYQYRCVITDANGNTMISNAATLTVKDPLYILIQPSSTTASLGETVSFTVTASGMGLTYQWQYLSSPSGTWKNTTLSGAKTNSLKVVATEVRNGYQYRCVITNASGKTVTSDAVTLTLVDALTITGQPKSTSATVGETVNFTVTASGEGLTYQWQYRTSSTGSWKTTTLSGAKTNTLKVIATDVRNGYQYRCVITDASGKTVTSDAATLTVKNALTITVQPKSASAAAGETVNFTVTASGEGLTYQWQYRTSSTGSWKTTTLSGAKTNTLKVIATDVRNGYQYRCVITDAGGNKVTSNAATLTVTAGLTITAQPKSTSATVGETVNFTVTASGEGLTYQWQYRTSSTGSWKNTTLSGAKTNTLKVTATDVRNGYQYRCVVTDAGGNKVTSNAATLTVETPISITHQPVSVTANLGETVTFTVTASGEGLTYQWQYRSSSTGSWKNTTLTGAKTDTLKAVATEARNGYQYRCVITDANGNTVTSVTVTLTVG